MRKTAIRILIDEPCEECISTGKVEIHICDEQPIQGFECPGKEKCGETATVECSECDGVGYTQERIGISAFIDLFIDEAKRKGIKI